MLIGSSLLYHNIMINLCELMVTSSEPTEVNRQLGNPQSLLSHSKMCFESLMRMYYLRHGFARSDTYLAHDLAVLAFMAQDRLKLLSSSEADDSPASVEDTRSTLILAAKGLHDQAENYYFDLILFHIVHNAMSPED